MRILCWVVSAVLLVSAQAGLADAEAETKDGKKDAFASYRPPMRGAPGGRIGGATRTGRDLPYLLALAPDHTGFTLESQPTLYWYVSGPAQVKLEITLLDEEGIDPILTQQMQGSNNAGIYAVSLAEHGITLKPGMEYQWFVALIPDPKQRSRDVTAGALIQKVDADPDLVARLKAANNDERPGILAQHGIWYDAVHRLSQEIQKGASAEYRRYRASLLEQVGLAEVAEFERRQLKAQ